MSNVSDAVFKIARDPRARASVLMKDLGANRVCLDCEAGRRVVSASTIKVPIMVTALEQVRLGRLALSDRLFVGKDVILSDSEVFDLGEREMEVEELIRWMIIVSDNTATNVLIRRLGMDRVNAYCEQLGLRDTRLEREMLDFAAIGAGRNNYTSALDQCALFEALERRRILTPALCGFALDVLLSQRCKDQFTRYIAAPVRLAHKTGGLDHLNHDSGVFYLDNITYYLGVFVTDAPDNDYAKRIVGRISKAVYTAALQGEWA